MATRKRLRTLVPLIERARKGEVYSDFEDLLGEAEQIELPGTGGAVASNESAQFRKKAEHFLKQNLAVETVAKVRNRPTLTSRSSRLSPAGHRTSRRSTPDVLEDLRRWGMVMSQSFELTGMGRRRASGDRQRLL